MDIKRKQGSQMSIDGQSSTGGLRLRVETGEDSARSALNDSTSKPKPEIVDPKSKGQPAVVGAIQQDLDTAANALKSIEDLKRIQLTYAKQARDTAYSSRTEQIETETETIQTEIQRIAEAVKSTTGESLLTKTTSLTYNDTSKNINEGLTIPNASSALTSPPQSSLTQENGETNRIYLEQDIAALEVLSISAEGGKEKARSLSSEVSPARAFRDGGMREPPLDIEAAQALAKKIAAKISSPYNKESLNDKLIDEAAGNLTTDKVMSLLI